MNYKNIREEELKKKVLSGLLNLIQQKKNSYTSAETNMSGLVN